MPSSKSRLRLAVLISGGGTNLQALLDRSVDGTLNADIVVVASDRADAFGLMRAKKAGVPTHVVDYIVGMQESNLDDIPADLDELDRTQKILSMVDSNKRKKRLSRLVFAEHTLIGKLEPYKPDYICLAGYMRLLTPYFLHHYNKEGEWRVLNIHPALLPSFPGQHGYESTFVYGCKWGGITVHFVDEGEDSGPIIAQAVYPIYPHDDVEKIRRRGLSLEYELYAQCINWLANEQVNLYQTAGGRTSALITDPFYSAILKNWIQKALS